MIEEVISTCGCTVPVYSKQPVRPGGTGTVTVTFDPKGRTGFFSKSIRVVSNSGQSVNTLWVKGTVDTVNRMEDEYPYSLSPDIRADRLTLSYGELQHSGTSKQLDIKICNRSDRVVKLSYLVTDKKRVLICVHAFVSSRQGLCGYKNNGFSLEKFLWYIKGQDYHLCQFRTECSYTNLRYGD